MGISLETKRFSSSSLSKKDQRARARKTWRGTDNDRGWRLGPRLGGRGICQVRLEPEITFRLEFFQGVLGCHCPVSEVCTGSSSARLLERKGAPS